MICACGSNRIIHISGKCDDRAFATVPSLSLEHEGYLPYLDGLCGGDYLRLKVCSSCGLVQGFKPLTEDDLQEAFLDDEG